MSGWGHSGRKHAHGARAPPSVRLNTLALLIREAFVHSEGPLPRDRCVLTSKAMTVMGVVPPQLKQPFASELSQAIKDDDEGRLATLIGDFFGSFAGSFWKSMAMGASRRPQGFGATLVLYVDRSRHGMSGELSGWGR